MVVDRVRFRVIDGHRKRNDCTNFGLDGRFNHSGHVRKLDRGIADCDLPLRNLPNERFRYRCGSEPGDAESAGESEPRKPVQKALEV